LPEQASGAARSVALALRAATGVPLQVAECAARAKGLIEALRPKTNPKMASDLTVAESLARAAMEGALANVEINLDSFDAGTEVEFVAEMRARLAEIRNHPR
jgi:glutamate formiminotransferase/formiminotetrahydrofolate cyclodeaminase